MRNALCTIIAMGCSIAITIKEKKFLPVWLRLSHWFLFCLLFIRSHLRWEKLSGCALSLCGSDAIDKYRQWRKVNENTVGNRRQSLYTMYYARPGLVWTDNWPFGMFSVIWSVRYLTLVWKWTEKTNTLGFRMFVWNCYEQNRQN